LLAWTANETTKNQTTVEPEEKLLPHRLSVVK